MIRRTKQKRFLAATASARARLFPEMIIMEMRAAVQRKGRRENRRRQRNGEN